MSLYLIANGPMPTTAALSSVTTGTAIKTMLQLKPGSTNNLKIKEWGISFDANTAATPIKCELIETDVAATVTASASADIMKLDGNSLNAGDPTTSNLAVGTTSTGYTSTSEGTITAVRIFDLQLVSPTGGYVKQFPLGLEPIIQPSKFGRIRVTAGAAVNCYCYMVVED